jgi:arylsulfatase
MAADPQPNIVVILMDNLGYGELGVYGGGIPRAGAVGNHAGRVAI